MRKCGVDECGKPTSTMMYKFKVNKNETLFNVWVCDECLERGLKHD